MQRPRQVGGVRGQNVVKARDAGAVAGLTEAPGSW